MAADTVAARLARFTRGWRQSTDVSGSAFDEELAEAAGEGLALTVAVDRPSVAV